MVIADGHGVVIEPRFSKRKFGSFFQFIVVGVYLQLVSAYAGCFKTGTKPSPAGNRCFSLPLFCVGDLEIIQYCHTLSPNTTLRTLHDCLPYALITVEPNKLRIRRVKAILSAFK